MEVYTLAEPVLTQKHNYCSILSNIAVDPDGENPS